MAHSRPPCASMMVRQIDRPIPKPPGFVVLKASKMRSRPGELRPGPESRTTTSTPSGSPLPVVITNSRDPSLTELNASTALMIRFMITCCSWTRSP